MRHAGIETKPLVDGLTNSLTSLRIGHGCKCCSYCMIKEDEWTGVKGKTEVVVVIPPVSYDENKLIGMSHSINGIGKMLLVMLDEVEIREFCRSKR